MGEAKHTPGPWHVGAQNDCLFVINKTPPRGDYDHELVSICKVGPSRLDEANARLIAAAPEMFAACEAMIKKVCEDVDGVMVLAVIPPNSPEIKAMRAAIAKAGGAAS